MGTMKRLDTTIKPLLRKRTGAHYTPSVLARFVAKNIFDKISTSKSTSQKLKIIDPAVGDGELLFAITAEAYSRGFKNISVTGFDINKDALLSTKHLIQKKFPKAELSLYQEDFLQHVLKNYKSSLFNKVSEDSLFDIVISNPPYVRTQVMGSSKAKQLAEAFGLSGRVDLYHAFIMGIEMIVKKNAIVGIIVSNRFMTTKSGQSIRKELLNKFCIEYIWDFGDTRLFEAAVLPAVLVLRKGSNIKNTPFYSSIYFSDNQTTINDPSEIFEALNDKENSNFNVSHGILDCGKNNGDAWRLATQDNDQWLKTVKKNTHLSFRDLGKIRVGIKTTADDIFIISDRSQFSGKEPETLRPLITHHVANRYRSNKPIKYVVYTHEIVDNKKKAVDLSNNPFTARYLQKHKEVLSKRSYIADSGRNWYEIWVPQNPDEWKRPKIVFRDISKQPVFWMDLEGNIVNGDCYWLSPNIEHDIDLLWLTLAIANSSFIEEFYDYSFNNKLYSGRRRFITQYVEKFPLPDPKNKTSVKIIEIAKRLYKQEPGENLAKPEEELNDLVYSVFGLDKKKVGR